MTQGIDARQKSTDAQITESLEVAFPRGRAFRLNRGGVRSLNSPLHMVAIVRMTHDGETREYVEKRRADGRTSLHQTLPGPPHYRPLSAAR